MKVIFATGVLEEAQEAAVHYEAEVERFRLATIEFRL